MSYVDLNLATAKSRLAAIQNKPTRSGGGVFINTPNTSQTISKTLLIVAIAAIAAWLIAKLYGRNFRN